MKTLSLHPLARADIRNVLARTLAGYGARQYARYEQLIEKALEVIAERPDRGHACEQPFGHLMKFRIERSGRRARHFFLYRVVGEETQVLRFLDDAVDVSRHLLEDWREP